MQAIAKLGPLGRVAPDRLVDAVTRFAISNKAG
jgi:hypothetical protein